MRRVSTGLILGGGWLLLLYWGGVWLFWLVAAITGAVALAEYFRLALREDEKRYLGPAIAIGLAPLAAATAGRADLVAASVFISLLLVVVLLLAVFANLAAGFDFMARLCFGAIYIGFCLAHLILIRMHGQGVSWLVLLSGITVGSDSGAYYIGRALGRSKLLPAVSAGKTRAGAVGGLITGLLAAWLFSALLFTEIDFIRLSAAALLLTIVAMVGDLAESIVKRGAGVKDSGQWLAGHGGLLDRGDSMLFAAPALYYLLHFGWLTAR